MNIQTKFNLGDDVYIISRMPKEIKVPTNCPVCYDTGSVTLNQREYLCPECRGRTYRTENAGYNWYVANKGYVIGIQARCYTPKHPLYEYMPKLAIVYTIVYERDDEYSRYSITEPNEDLVFSTFEEAQAECDKRNVEENKKFEEKSKKSEVDSD